MKDPIKFITHIGAGCVGDSHDRLTRAAIESIIDQHKHMPILITGISNSGKTGPEAMMRLFPTMNGNQMIEASITIESGIDISKLLVGDKFNHSVGMRLIKEDEL